MLLQTGQSDEYALRAGLAELLQWEHWRVALERDFGDDVVGSGPVRGQLTTRGAEGRTLAATGLAVAFAEANDRCLAGAVVSAQVADAEMAARFPGVALNLFEALEDNQSLSRGAVQIAAPDLNRHGLSFAAAAARLCLQLKIDDVVLPNLGTGTLTVVAGVTLGGGPLVFSRRPVSSTVRTLPTPVQGARPSGRPTPPDG